MELKNEQTKFKEQLQDLNSRVVRSEANTLSYQKQLHSLAKKKLSDANKIIASYHNSEDFMQFMDRHDDELRPFNMSVGWNKAIGVVSSKYPSVVNPEDFSCPTWAVDSGSHDVDHASGSGGSRRPSGMRKAANVVSSGSTSSRSAGKKAMSEREAATRRAFLGKQLRARVDSSTET